MNYSKKGNQIDLEKCTSRQLYRRDMHDIPEDEHLHLKKQNDMFCLFIHGYQVM
jgi:hypothetical protein